MYQASNALIEEGCGFTWTDRSEGKLLNNPVIGYLIFNISRNSNIQKI